MSEMVERVAKAIYESHRFVRPWDHPNTVKLWHRSCRASARAAIEAMRSPTEDMRASCGNGECAKWAPGAWQNYIDAALRD